MKIAILVNSKTEGEQIRIGLDDPEVRAFVRVVAILSQLPSDRARGRVLRFFAEQIDDQLDEARKAAAGS